MLDREQLDQPVSCFDEEVEFSNHTKARIEDLEPGHAVLPIDTAEIYLNGNRCLRGSVDTTRMEQAMGLCVESLVGSRTATTQMSAHLLGLSVRDASCVVARSCPALSGWRPPKGGFMTNSPAH